MPPAKGQVSRFDFTRSVSNNEATNSARIYHHATNLTPPSQPSSPTGAAAGYSSSFSKSTSSFGRQNSQSNYKQS